MVDMQSTPDSAVSPTYSAFPSSRYDVDVALDSSFYYPVCAQSSSIIADVAQLAGDGLDVHAASYSTAAGPHHGSNKRLKYAAADNVGGISFARTDNHHQHVACQQWNTGTAASHGIRNTHFAVWSAVLPTFGSVI